MLFAVVLAALTLALPGASLVVQSRQISFPQYNIHPNGDTSKCIGVSNGVLAPGSAVTIFDCNGSPSQNWAWWGTGRNRAPLFVTNPTDNKRLCMTVPDIINLENGAKLQLRECQSTDGVFWPDESFSRLDSDPSLLFGMPSSTDSWNSMCVDLTDGSKVNRNVLQLWQCAPSGQPTYQNQIWTLTAL